MNTQSQTVSFQDGDVIVNSWGYDQTNIDFYQVVEVLPKSIRVREISAQTVSGTEGFMCDKVVAVKDSFQGDPKVIRIGKRGNLCSRHGYICKWDGQPEHRSWYA